MTTVTITKIYRSFKDKQGNTLRSKDGREYEKVAIQTAEYGDKWIGGFGNKSNSYWREGDIVDIIIEENGQFMNFKMPRVWDEIRDLKKRIEELENRNLGKPQVNKGYRDPMPDDMF